MSAHGSRFDRLALGAIAANTVVLVWGLVDHEHAEMAEALETGLLWFFAVELAARFRRAGRCCWRDRWLWFDVVVVTVALMPVGVNMTALRAARLTDFGRYVSHLRLVAVARWLRAQVYRSQVAYLRRLETLPSAPVAPR